MALDIVLDPRNEEELLNQVSRYIFEKSNGTLSNLNISNPLIFLLEAQVFAGSELLWYVNQLPAKLLLYFLSQFQDIQETATKATGTLLLNLTSPLASDYTITNLEVSSGEEVFRLVSPVTFTAGNTQSTGLIESVEPGSRFNKPPFSINTIITPRPFLTSVTNLNPTENGADELTAEEAITKYSNQFLDSQLVSLEDYRVEVVRLVGSNYPVKVVYQEGINILLGNEAPIDLIRSVQSELERKSIITASIAVQRLVSVPLAVNLIVAGDAGLGDSFYQYLAESLDKYEVLTRDDLVGLVSQFGYTFIDGYFDQNANQTKELNYNEYFYLKFLSLTVNGLTTLYGVSDDVV